MVHAAPAREQRGLDGGTTPLTEAARPQELGISAFEEAAWPAMRGSMASEGSCKASEGGQPGPGRGVSSLTA